MAEAIRVQGADLGIGENAAPLVGDHRATVTDGPVAGPRPPILPGWSHAGRRVKLGMWASG
jgi:hypothetical protein